MPFCCSFLDYSISQMGQAGLSVVLKSEMGVMFFCLQGRAVDAAEAERLGKQGQSDREGLLGKIRLVEQVALTYCPSCGCKLENWISDHRREADELAERSRPFVM